MVIDRTITAKSECCYLSLHDMSKAFDTVDRSKLINELQEVINTDELHLITKLMDVKLAARCGQHVSDYFNTDTGVPQGDCMSANEFTFYLSKALEKEVKIDHDYCKPIPTITPQHERNYAIAIPKQHLTLDMESNKSNKSNATIDACK